MSLIIATIFYKIYLTPTPLPGEKGLNKCISFSYPLLSLEKGAERKEFARWANLARSLTAGVEGDEVDKLERGLVG